MDNVLIYSIELLTSCHCASGNSTFGDFVNRVQRDSYSNIPCINATNLKGSLNHFILDNNLKVDFQTLTISKALLLLLSVHSRNKPYKLVTCELLIKNMQVELEYFHAIQNGFSIFHLLKENYGEGFEILPDVEFIELINYLPIIARNNLIQTGLGSFWYEELIPLKSYFLFVLSSQIKEQVSLFDKYINDTIIQIGSHKNTGQGYAKLKRISNKTAENS